MHILKRSSSRLIAMLALIAIMAGLLPLNIQLETSSAQARTAHAPLNDDADPWVTVLPASLDGVQVLQTVNEADAHGIDSDDFNYCELDTDVWTFRDPPGDGASYDTNGTQLLITVPPNKNYNLWKGMNNAARVTQSVSNADFQVVAKFESTLLPVKSTGNPFRLQGIIVEGVTTQNFPVEKFDELLRFGFYSQYKSSKAENEIYAFGASVRDASAIAYLKEKIYSTSNLTEAGPSTLYMRITRQMEDNGDILWIMEYSLDGSTWTAVDYDPGITPDPGAPDGSFIRNLDLDDSETPGAIGVYAGSWATNPEDPVNGAPGHTAIVDYFFESASPINPEDGKSNDLTTNTVGNGSIDVDPDQATYVCGESIEFEAMPDAGWAFTGWSGDLSGSVNPKTAEYVLGMDVTATFTQTSSMYPLDVTIQGNGSVVKNPDAAEYEEGTEVTVTATADAGYRFVGWSGDETSSNNPLTVVMNSAKSIVAEFEEIPDDTYTLDVQVFPTDGSGGTATKSPDQASYPVDTEVTLTATPKPGYTFNGWTGLITSSDEIVTVKVPAQNSVMLASFVEAAYTVTTQVNGNGSIAVLPVQPTYSFGDEVTITAIPDDEATFFSWGGDVGGSENPQTITITDNTNIIATFSGGDQMTYLPLAFR